MSDTIGIGQPGWAEACEAIRSLAVHGIAIRGHGFDPFAVNEFHEIAGRLTADTAIAGSLVVVASYWLASLITYAAELELGDDRTAEQVQDRARSIFTFIDEQMGQRSF